MIARFLGSKKEATTNPPEGERKGGGGGPGAVKEEKKGKKKEGAYRSPISSRGQKGTAAIEGEGRKKKKDTRTSAVPLLIPSFPPGKCRRSIASLDIR